MDQPTQELHLCTHAPGVAHELTCTWRNSGFLPRGSPALRSCPRESGQRRRWRGRSCPGAVKRDADVASDTAARREKGKPAAQTQVAWSD